MHPPGGVATRAERTKVRLAAAIQDSFRKNGARGIPGAKKQDVVAIRHRSEVQLQQSVPQQGTPTGFVARRNALMNLSFTSGPTFSALNPAACRNSRASSTW